jgi:hypothetical protein
MHLLTATLEALEASALLEELKRHPSAMMRERVPTLAPRRVVRVVTIVIASPEFCGVSY